MEKEEKKTQCSWGPMTPPLRTNTTIVRKNGGLVAKLRSVILYIVHFHHYGCRGKS